MIALPLLVLLAARPVAAPRPQLAPTVHRWPDGLELVVQRVPGAQTASLRLVIRTGGANDPADKAGLAHILEHLLHGGRAGRELLRTARGAGAIVNAHTSASWTTFELDAPADRFAPLAERYLRLVTSPAWEEMNLEVEKGVIETEADFDEAAAETSMMDRALFPAPSQAGPLIGTASSRTEARPEDVIGLFRARYLPPLTTVVMTGAVEPEAAIALVERAYLVPPVPAPPPRPAEVLNLPMEQRVPALLTATAQGYLLDPADRGMCREVAALLQLRLVLAVRESGPRVSEVAGSCVHLRGRDFLVGFAFTSTLDAPELPAEMDAVFRGLVQSPPTRDERARIDRRLARERERVLSAPAELAQALAMQAADSGTADLPGALPRSLPSAEQLRRALGRSLTPDRRFQLVFAPMD